MLAAALQQATTRRLGINNMKRRFRASVLAAALLLSATAHAGIIEYDVTNVGGSTWRYDYAVTNDAQASGLGEFTIWFARDLYASLGFPTAAADWDPLVIQPDPALPADGFFDALALGASLALNATLGGFSVSFDWLGTGTPGAQAFDFIDPVTFAVLESGVTRQRVMPDPTPVPEPAIALMFAAGFAAVTFATRRRRVH
jgi:hypothetical protein